MGQVTMRDVAAATGVSITTVSDSLSGKGRLPADTRRRIQRVAHELGYRPSAAARTLQRGRTGVLVISMRPDDVEAESLWHVDFFMKVLTGAATEASNRGYVLAVAPAPARSGLAYDGMIVVDPTDGDVLLQQAVDRGSPIATVGRAESILTSTVDNDYDALVGETLDVLARRGARRPMLLVHESEASYVGDVEREYSKWCQRRQIEPIIERVHDAFNLPRGRAAARRVLADPRRPDAVFAGLDQLALATELAAEDLALSVPDDVMIVSLGDGPSVANATVPISALELHADEMGRVAVEMLLAQIEHGAKPQQQVVPSQLVERTSTVR